MAKKYIKDLNVRQETIKLLKKNISRTHYDINHSKILYDQLPRVMEIKRKYTNNTDITYYQNQINIKK